MYFSICFLVVLTLVSIPCDAQFGNFRPFGGDEGGFGGMGGLEVGGMGEMGMGGMGMGGMGMEGMGMEGMGMEGMGMGKGGMSKMGNWAPLIPTEDERQMCEVEANDQAQKLVKTLKVPKQTCKVMCQMDNGEKSVLMSPEGTMCCDIGGVGPTGKCDGNGKCNMMGMEGMSE